MLRNNRSGLVTAAAIGAGAAGAFVLWRQAEAARQRREMLERGEIRQLHEVWRRVGSYRIFARVAESAGRDDIPPVVLVHGWGMSSAYWIPAAERLARDFSVYAPDLPGHGRSDTPLKPFTVRFLARVLLRWIRVMELPRVTLVGHSMGAQIAAEAALQDPSHVNRLVLIGLASDPRGRTLLQQLQRLVSSSLHERVALGAPSAKDLLRMGARLVPEYRFMIDHAIEQKLAKIRQPVLLVRGGEDYIAPQRWIEEAAELLGTERIAVIPGWGHAVQFSAPGETVAAIRPFLREQLVTQAAPAGAVLR